MKRYLAVLLAIGCLATVVAITTATAGGSASLAIGFVDPAVNVTDLGQAQKAMDLDKSLGARWVRILKTWIPTQHEGFNDIASVCNAYQAADKDSLVVLFNLVPGWNTALGQHPPLAPNEKRMFATTAAWYVHEIVQVCQTTAKTLYFEIGNEPNNPYFWAAQFNADGTEAACTAYESLLAYSYGAVKKKARELDIDVQVIGGALASSGNDDPHSGRPSTSPVSCIDKMGAAYRESGRKNRIMDIFSTHPYGESSADPPTSAHSDGTLGLADYGQLTAALGKAFDGTGQPGSAIPILYSEYGVITDTPAAKAGFYTNPLPSSVTTVSPQVQANYYTTALNLVQQQPDVIGLLYFHSVDDAADPMRTGLFYPDGSAKPSKSAVRQAMLAVP